MIDFIVHNAAGEILRYGTSQPEMMENQIAAGEFVIEGLVADAGNQFIHGGELCDLTAAERKAKASLAPGWIWKMPERIAVDPRTNARRAIDAAAAISAARAAAYPPMTDLADALYWQANGDRSKMDAYMAACELVKLTHPFP